MSPARRRLRARAAALVVIAIVALVGPEAAASTPPESVSDGTIVYGACEGGQNQYGCAVAPTGHEVGVDEATVNTAPEVFLRGPDGSERRLTYNSVHERDLTFSPSGSEVAFSTFRDEGGSCRVYTMSLAGGVMTPVTPEEEWACATVEDWSPDGEWLLVSLYWPEARWSNLYKVRPDGSDFTQLTNICDEDTGVWEAFWVRGSQSVVMDASIRRGRKYGDGLHSVDSDGNRLRLLRDIEVVDVALGPGGRSLFVATYPPGKRDGEVYELDLHGNTVRRLTHNRVDEEQLTFSPDGSKLLFAATKQDTRGEEPARGRILDLSSGRVEPLHLPSNVRLDPILGFDWVWSPDGTKVALRVHELDWSDRIVWTSVEERAHGELVEERPKLRLFGWLP